MNGLKLGAGTLAAVAAVTLTTPGSSAEAHAGPCLGLEMVVGCRHHDPHPERNEPAKPLHYVQTVTTSASAMPMRGLDPNLKFFFDDSAADGLFEMV